MRRALKQKAAPHYSMSRFLTVNLTVDLITDLTVDATRFVTIRLRVLDTLQ